MLEQCNFWLQRLLGSGPAAVGRGSDALSPPPPRPLLCLVLALDPTQHVGAALCERNCEPPWFSVGGRHEGQLRGAPG